MAGVARATPLCPCGPLPESKFLKFCPLCEFTSLSQKGVSIHLRKIHGVFANTSAGRPRQRTPCTRRQIVPARTPLPPMSLFRDGRRAPPVGTNDHCSSYVTQFADFNESSVKVNSEWTALNPCVETSNSSINPSFQCESVRYDPDSYCFGPAPPSATYRGAGQQIHGVTATRPAPPRLFNAQGPFDLWQGQPDLEVDWPTESVFIDDLLSHPELSRALTDLPLSSLQDELNTESYWLQREDRIIQCPAENSWEQAKPLRPGNENSPRTKVILVDQVNPTISMCVSSR